MACEDVVLGLAIYVCVALAVEHNYFFGYIGSLQQLHVSTLSLGHHQVVSTKP